MFHEVVLYHEHSTASNVFMMYDRVDLCKHGTSRRSSTSKAISAICGKHDIGSRSGRCLSSARVRLEHRRCGQGALLLVRSRWFSQAIVWPFFPLSDFEHIMCVKTRGAIVRVDRFSSDDAIDDSCDSVTILQ